MIIKSIIIIGFTVRSKITVLKQQNIQSRMRFLIVTALGVGPCVTINWDQGSPPTDLRAVTYQRRHPPSEFHAATGSPTTSRMPSSWLANPKSNPWRGSNQGFQPSRPHDVDSGVGCSSNQETVASGSPLPSSSRVIEKREKTPEWRRRQGNRPIEVYSSLVLFCRSKVRSLSNHCFRSIFFFNFNAYYWYTLLISLCTRDLHFFSRIGLFLLFCVVGSV